MLAAPVAVNGGGVEKPPDTALPERQCATAAGPICAVAGVATVVLALFSLGTLFWQYTATPRSSLPARSWAETRHERCPTLCDSKTTPLPNGVMNGPSAGV